MPPETSISMVQRHMGRAEATRCEKLASTAHEYYRMIKDNGALTYLACGTSGTVLFMVDVFVYRVVHLRVRGERIIQATADERSSKGCNSPESADYVLSVEGGQVLTDATKFGGGEKFANYSCSPNARFVTVRLDGSVFDIVMLEAISTIPADTEVFVSIGWVYFENDTVVICDCGSRL